MPAPAPGQPRPSSPYPIDSGSRRSILDVAPAVYGDHAATTRAGIGDVVLAEIESVALVGTEAYFVRAEVDANTTGLPKFVDVGSIILYNGGKVKPHSQEKA